MSALSVEVGRAVGSPLAPKTRQKESTSARHIPDPEVCSFSIGLIVGPGNKRKLGGGKDVDSPILEVCGALDAAGAGTAGCNLLPFAWRSQRVHQCGDRVYQE